jgi:hypothetical protein
VTTHTPVLLVKPGCQVYILLYLASSLDSKKLSDKTSIVVTDLLKERTQNEGSLWNKVLKFGFVTICSPEKGRDIQTLQKILS